MGYTSDKRNLSLQHAEIHPVHHKRGNNAYTTLVAHASTPTLAYITISVKKEASGPENVGGGMRGLVRKIVQCSARLLLLDLDVLREP